MHIRAYLCIPLKYRGFLKRLNGAAILANAGISALEGSYFSAGMYAVTGLIPLAGKLADIGEMAWCSVTPIN